MKNREIVKIMDNKQFVEYKKKLNNICNEIGMVVHAKTVKKDGHIVLELRTGGTEFNPLELKNYGKIDKENKFYSNRYNFGYKRIEYLHKTGLIENLNYRYKENRNHLYIKLSEIDVRKEKTIQDIESAETKFIFRTDNFNLMCKNSIPAELNSIKYFDDLIDYLDFINEYLINCVMYNNVYHKIVVEKLSQNVTKTTTEDEIIKNILTGKDRVHTDTTSIERVISTMNKIGLSKYYIIVE